MGSFSRVVFLSLALVAVSASSFLFIKKEFFPESDRSEFLLSFELAPGADIASTDKLLREVESLLKQEKSVTSVAAFAGGSIPRFYYNLPNPMRAPQSGQVLITTRNLSDVKPLGTKLESQLQAAHPDVDVVAHFLQQGPPINAKIEVQFFSPSADRRQQVLGEIEKAYRADASLRAIRGDLDLPLNVQSFNAREERLAQAGLTREDLNLALAFHSSGLVATQFRSGRELIPVRLKSLDHVRTNDSALANALALRGRARDYRISELATSQIRQELSLVRRLNSERYGRAMADLKSGETFDRALERLRPRIESIKLLPGERLEFAGDAKGAGEANTSIFKVVPMALLFLFAFLLLEFRSLRKVAIALIALPITILGAFPGLFLGGAPFGFMSLLGVLALVGIAVNNIILLLEAMENGKSVREAIAVRFRAIFLTTVLTLLGLIPLTLDASSLWPPLAWTMISGLFTGTLVTLIVVPALYRAMYASQSVGMNLGLLLVIGATFGLSTNSRAEAVNAASAVSIEFLMEQVENSPEDQASRAAVSAKDSLERAAQYGAFLPRVTAGGEVSRRDRDLTTQSPLGPITAEEKNRFQGQIEIQQPIFDKAEMFDLRQTARLQKEAAEQKRRHERAEIQYAVGARAIEILILERQARFMEDSINLLQSRRRDIVRLVAKGRLSSTDLLKIDLSITTLDQKKNDLRSQIENFKVELAQRLGRAEIASIRIPAAPLEKNLSEVASLDSRVSDAEALALDGQALRHQARAVGASHLPTLDAFARWTRVDGTRVLEKNWGEVGIGLKWEIFGAGRRGPQAQALGAQAVALDAQALALRRTRALEESEATRRIQDRLTWRSRMESLRPQAQSIREAEAKRYFEGRGSLNDLVDADSVFLEISRDIELSELEASLACLRLTSLKTQKVNTSCAVESP
jgi:outer membrane protein TolC